MTPAEAATETRVKLAEKDKTTWYWCDDALSLSHIPVQMLNVLSICLQQKKQNRWKRWDSLQSRVLPSSSFFLIIVITHLIWVRFCHRNTVIQSSKKLLLRGFYVPCVVLVRGSKVVKWLKTSRFFFLSRSCILYEFLEFFFTISCNPTQQSKGKDNYYLGIGDYRFWKEERL